MTANIAFSLTAAVASLAIVVLAGLKGDWAVVAVYAALVLGFLARASFGRSARAQSSTDPGSEGRPRSAGEILPEDVPRQAGPEHEPERQLKPARFKRR